MNDDGPSVARRSPRAVGFGGIGMSTHATEDEVTAICKALPESVDNQPVPVLQLNRDPSKSDCDDCKDILGIDKEPLTPMPEDEPEVEDPAGGEAGEGQAEETLTRRRRRKNS